MPSLGPTYKFCFLFFSVVMASSHKAASGLSCPMTVLSDSLVVRKQFLSVACVRKMYLTGSFIVVMKTFSIYVPRCPAHNGYTSY